MNDTHARARVWTLCLAALVRAALTGPLAALLAPLVHASAPALTMLAAALVGAYVALAVLLARAVLRVVWPRSTDQRSPALHAHLRSAILG
jgi:ABC-type transport system involved in cytochrome bd biosynthesis fused ATPase/permease subunit